MTAYQNQREHFEKILKKYWEYVALYKKINNGSLKGVAIFDEFYWRYTYYSRYIANENIERRGY